MVNQSGFENTVPGLDLLPRSSREENMSEDISEVEQLADPPALDQVAPALDELAQGQENYLSHLLEFGLFDEKDDYHLLLMEKRLKRQKLTSK